MPKAIGRHLLGRVPSPKDARDWKLSEYLAKTTATPSVREIGLLDFVMAVLQWLLNLVSPTPTPDPTPTPSPTPTPTPTPSPTPSPTAKVWADPIRLDQGDTPHCVGFGWAGWGDADPVEDRFQNVDGHAIYYECKVIDGEPGMEDGSDVRSGAKAMKNRGRVGSCYFAASIDEVKQWVLNHGTIVLGTDWYDNMFSPDANGFVRPTGTIAGGHCYLCIGYDVSTDAFLCQNSWGSSWGLDGRFRLKAVDLALLLDSAGDACAATELPL